jgi:hypothetical protein
MKTSHIQTKPRPVNASARAHSDAVDLEFKISKTALGIIAVLSAFIGIWGLVCLTSGFLMSSDIFELGSNWFTAVMGL